jgi:hypothetical protein
VADWVLAAERIYVAAAVSRNSGAAAAAESATGAEPAAGAEPATGDEPAAGAEPATGAEPAGLPAPRVLMRSDWRTDLPAADRRAHALAAAGAVASRHLAVSAPRSFGIVIDDLADVAAATLSLSAHRAWFAPRDVRCASTATGAAELAAATGGRTVSLDEALACDIVNVYSARIRIIPAQLRRGTHVNALAAGVLDPELLALATVVPEAGLPALAAGLVDGRQLDELTIFVISQDPSLATIDRGEVP